VSAANIFEWYLTSAQVALRNEALERWHLTGFEHSIRFKTEQRIRCDMFLLAEASLRVRRCRRPSGDTPEAAEEFWQNIMVNADLHCLRARSGR